MSEEVVPSLPDEATMDVIMDAIGNLVEHLAPGWEVTGLSFNEPGHCVIHATKGAISIDAHGAAEVANG